MSVDRYAEAKQKDNRNKLIKAYENYVNNPMEHENEFWRTILDFAKLKLHYLELEFSKTGTSGTADDYAQQVALGVWKGLSSFKGDRNNFYAWVHSICYKHAADFFRELKEQKDTKVGTTVVVNDDEGEDEEIDNPEIYRNELRDSFIRIPNSVQGIDRDICLFILDGMNYQQIATELGKTEQAIKDRAYKLRNRLAKEEEEARSKSKRDRAAKEAERKGGPTRGLNELRARKAAVLASIEKQVKEESEVLV